MTSIENLLLGPWPHPVGASPAMDPLTETDALQEAQLLDARLHAVTSTVGLLFELRTALQFPAGNSAVLVGRRVREFTWTADAVSSTLTAWSVVGSVPGSDGRSFTLDLRFAPRAQLRIAAADAAFYVIDVPNLGEVPPNYTAEDEELTRSRIVGWENHHSLLQASYVEPF